MGAYCPCTGPGAVPELIRCLLSDGWTDHQAAGQADSGRHVPTRGTGAEVTSRLPMTTLWKRLQQQWLTCDPLSCSIP